MDKLKGFLKKLQFWKKDATSKKAISDKTKKQEVDTRPKMRRGWKVTFITIVWLFALVPWLVFWLWLKSASSEGLPSTKELENPTTHEASEIITADGVSIGKYYAENRTPVTFAQISSHMVDALIATEDERYMNHPGIDVKSIPRVVQGVMSGNSSAGGGSTITQQLAKMLFSERNFSDMGKLEKLKALVDVKLREWVMATELERKFTKEEIITMYFNKFDFLNNAVGVHSAARVYFNKTPDLLKIEEAALLVGMAKNPAYFNPMRFEERTKGRRNQVLKQWLRNSNKNNPSLKLKITSAECDSLMKLPVVLDFQKVDHQSGIAPYFREILRESVVDTLANMYLKNHMNLRKVLSESEYSSFNDSLIVILDKSDTKEEILADKKALLVRWAKYMIYNKGLKIYTTIDSKLQAYGEYAVKEWLGKELQNKLEQKQRKRLKEEWPFDVKGKNNDNKFYKKEERLKEIDKVINTAMRRSERWKSLKASGVPETERLAIFNEPKSMKVFSWEGEIDTVMTPRDSIRYYKQFLQAGLMSMDPKTGYVKCWVGGTDFYHFKYDHVIKSRRQVGSTFKPFIYATALDLGAIDPCKEVPNVQYCVDLAHNKLRNKEWCPKGSEYDGEETTMKFGLAGSMNNITAYVMRELGNFGRGPELVKKRVIEMGLPGEQIAAVPAMCLGIATLSVYEMVGAQSTFVNNGVYTKPIIISRIEDKLGNVIYDADPQMKEVFNEETAYLTLRLMQGVTQGATRRDGKSAGTAAGIRSTYHKWGGIRHPMAGKTGTTQNGSDGWFIGLTPDLVTGVWVGAEDIDVHFPTLQWGQGGRMALPIYGYYMQKVYGDKRIKISTDDFERPSTPIQDDAWNCKFRDEDDGTLEYGDGDDHAFGDDYP